MSLAEKYTSIVRKYPTHRDDLIRGCWKYMQGRRADDEAEGLWRVHDKLYDLTHYIDRHPGGRQWLLLTKGTDVTEAFETHHLTPTASDVLKKFYIRDATKPRNYKYTYNETGFYKTLKRRVVKKLETIDVNELSKFTKLILNCNLIALFVLVLLAVRAENTIVTVFWTFLAGQSLAWSLNFAHNFMHQKDNWRMYTANLTLVSFRDFRVFHVMSHHMFPNTITDMEVSDFEFYLRWLPYTIKTTSGVLLSYVLSPITWTLVFPFVFLRRVFGNILSETKVFHYDELIAFVLPTFMLIFERSPLTFYVAHRIFWQWMSIIMIASFLYTLFAVNSGHHSPEITHEGDEFDNLDFGVFQIKAIVDRQAVDDHLFTVLGYYGLHTLHHMFPTLDHSVLPQLEETFLETCKDFSVEFHKKSVMSAVTDQFKQLARSEIRKIG